MGLGGGDRLILAQGRESSDDGLDLRGALFFGRLDGGENLANLIHGGQQRVGDLRGHDPLAVPQKAQQVLTCVGHPLQVAEPQEPAGSLDGVQRAEDLFEDSDVVRRLFEYDEVLVQLIEPLVALD